MIYLDLMANDVDIAWTVINQAAQEARDTELCTSVSAIAKESETQIFWLRTRMKQAAPRALLVAI